MTAWWKAEPERCIGSDTLSVTAKPSQSASQTAVPLLALACHLPRPGESFPKGEPLAGRSSLSRSSEAFSYAKAWALLSRAGLPGVTLSVACGDSSPKVGAKNVAVKPLPLPLGEVASRRDDGEGRLPSVARPGI